MPQRRTFADKNYSQYNMPRTFGKPNTKTFSRKLAKSSDHPLRPKQTIHLAYQASNILKTIEATKHDCHLSAGTAQAHPINRKGGKKKERLEGVSKIEKRN